MPTDIRESPIYPLMLRQLDVARPPVELYDLPADPGSSTTWLSRTGRAYATEPHAGTGVTEPHTSAMESHANATERHPSAETIVLGRRERARTSPSFRPICASAC